MRMPRDVISTQQIVSFLFLCFLVFNLFIRVSWIFSYPPYNGMIAGLLGAVAAASLFVYAYPRYLRVYLCLFGFSFFLFGFGSIDIQSRLFEVIVCGVALTVFGINQKTRSNNPAVNKQLSTFLICYAALAGLSLLLLPLPQILEDFFYFGFPDAFFYLFVSPPYTAYFPLAALLRLLLFVVLALLLARLQSSRDSFKWLFSGIFSGAVFCAVLGIMEFYGLIPLAWYRMGQTAIPGVLHSTFLNSGWFAEYILVSVPFVLIGIIRSKRLWTKLALLSTLVICEIALIFCAARAGWVSYPLILFFCWLFIYFSREGRLKNLRLQWRPFLKIAVSVPITIGISLFIVVQVLIPLLDDVRNDSDFSGKGASAESEKQYLRQEASTVFMPSSSSRPMRWKQGFSIGMEQPLFGLGFGTYARHALILSDIPSSGYAQVKGSNAYTPHSTFFQLFVSGGIVGLGFWILLMVYAFVLLIIDLIKNNRLLNIPVLIAIIAFHTYGVFQSMQYVPMVWLMIFLFLGYALTLDQRVLPRKLQLTASWMTKVCIVLVLLGGLAYANNFGSVHLAQKYDLTTYSLEQDASRLSGFYPPSKRWTYGDYHWFGKTGAIFLSSAKELKLEFFCRTPGMEQNPVKLTISSNGKDIEHIVFSEQQAVQKTYRPDLSKEEQQLILKVSRTWIPHEHLGNYDRRELGVGVKILADS